MCIKCLSFPLDSDLDAWRAFEFIKGGPWLLIGELTAIEIDAA